MKLLSCVQLFATPWTVAYQAPPSMGFSRQECWSGLPFPSPGHLPDPGIEPRSPALQADALPSEPPGGSFLVGSRSSACSLHYLYIPWFSFHHCLASRDIYSLSDENKVSLFSPALLHLNSIIHPKPTQEFIQANLLLKV